MEVDPRKIYGKICKLISKGEEFAIATIVKTQGSTPRREGTKMIIMRNGAIYGTVGGGPVEKKVITEAVNAIQDGKHRFLTFKLEEEKAGMLCGGNMDIFIEPVTSGFGILIVGGGHVGKALARLASVTGYPCTVIDPSLSKKEFPDATQLMVKDCVEGLAEVEINHRTCIVIATGSHETDMAALKKVIDSNAYYIGMIGSRRKVEAIFKRLTEENVSPSKLRNVSAPIGLDIGAEAPGEIAVSILAEIISKIRAGKTH